MNALYDDFRSSYNEWYDEWYEDNHAPTPVNPPWLSVFFFDQEEEERFDRMVEASNTVEEEMLTGVFLTPVETSRQFKRAEGSVKKWTRLFYRYASAEMKRDLKRQLRRTRRRLNHELTCEAVDHDMNLPDLPWVLRCRR